MEITQEMVEAARTSELALSKLVNCLLPVLGLHRFFSRTLELSDFKSIASCEIWKAIHEKKEVKRHFTASLRLRIRNVILENHIAPADRVVTVGSGQQKNGATARCDFKFISIDWCFVTHEMQSTRHNKEHYEYLVAEVRSQLNGSAVKVFDTLIRYPNLKHRRVAEMCEMSEGNVSRIINQKIKPILLKIL